MNALHLSRPPSPIILAMVAARLVGLSGFAGFSGFDAGFSLDASDFSFDSTGFL